MPRLPSPTPSATPRVYGYARVSTDQQRDNGISLDEQQRRIEGRCLEMGWQLSEVFVEAGVSGSVPFASRPQGNALMRRLQPGDIVVSPKLDRCFRSSLDALQTIQELKKKGVSLWLLDLGGDVSGNGISEMMLTILAAVAQFERVRIGERIRDARAHLRHEGKHLGGSRPFGYCFGPVEGRGRARTLIEEPAEQAAIAQMRAMRQGGASLFAIRDALRAQGFQISHQTVRRVLTQSPPVPRFIARERAGAPAAASSPQPVRAPSAPLLAPSPSAPLPHNAYRPPGR
jgi:DNA invertase Pin-like site-specific DNA recombinase